jgi:hypothetical protein
MDISNILKQGREINKLSYPHLTTQLLNYLPDFLIIYYFYN